MKKKSLEEVARMESLQAKEYLVKELDYNISDELIIAEVQCKGLTPEGIYSVGSKRFDTVNSSSKVCVDEEGLPYHENILGPITYQTYERIFLEDTDFGSRMVRLNQSLLLAALNQLKKQKHSVYHKFRSYMDELIVKLPHIKKAMCSLFWDNLKLSTL